MTRRAAIIGAGSYGEVFASYLREGGGVELAGFFDDDPSRRGTTVAGLPVLGTTAELPGIAGTVADVYAPIGNNAARVRVLSAAREQGFRTPGFVHASAVVSGDTQIGEGVYIMPAAVLMPWSRIEDYVMISMNALIAHHVVLERGAFVSTGVNMGAAISVGQNAFFGIGSTVMTGVKRIGAHATVGAGAVVIRDVEDGATVVGNPARPLPPRGTAHG